MFDAQRRAGQPPGRGPRPQPGIQEHRPGWRGNHGGVAARTAAKHTKLNGQGNLSERSAFSDQRSALIAACEVHDQRSVGKVEPTRITRTAP